MTDFSQYPIYAIDIETDNSEGKGLDPTEAAVTSIAIVGPDRSFFMQVDPADEIDLLYGFSYFMSDLPFESILATWNGGAFDFPFLTVRHEYHSVATTWVLRDRDDRSPKYQPTPPFKGVCRVLPNRGRTHHVDVAYLYDQSFCDTVECKWSLKSVAEHHGMVDQHIMALGVHGEDASRAPTPRLAAYNIHDAWVTMRLAEHAIRVLSEADQFRHQIDTFPA